MATVYLINEFGTDNYKIGITRSKASKRKGNLQTGNSDELLIIHSYETEHPFKLERMLHMHFFKKRGIGEWFTLEPDDVFCFMELCDKLNETITYLKDNNEFF